MMKDKVNIQTSSDAQPYILPIVTAFWRISHEGALKYWKNKRCDCQKNNAPYCTALSFFLPLTLKDDLNLAPLKHTQIHEIHMHAKYRVAMINIAKAMTIFRNLNASVTEF